MNINTITYPEYLKDIPKKGRHIMAHQSRGEILVYMAFNDAIADFAIANQKLGGDAFLFHRMSWIKTSFLWMMYRSSWASKENQNRILAISLQKNDFEKILEQAVHSSYQEQIYKTPENWKAELIRKKVRLQWDPDHDPFSDKTERKAIQLGLKGKLLRQFALEMIIKIEDITAFVKTQKEHLQAGGTAKLILPKEKIFIPNKGELQKTIDYECLLNTRLRNEN